MPGIIHIDAIPDYCPAMDIPWSDVPPPQQVQKSIYVPHKLMSEEVWELVQEWYAGQGQKVPQEEQSACLEDITKEKKEMEKWRKIIAKYESQYAKIAKEMAEYKPPEPEPESVVKSEGESTPQPQPKPAPAPASTPAPEFGSREYWAAYWAKKRAEGYVPKKDQKKSAGKTA